MIGELSAQQVERELKIETLEQKVANPRQIKLTKIEFLNVVKTAADKMKAGSAIEKDALCRILFLNVRVNNEKVVSYLWREPFATLVKSVENSLGREITSALELYSTIFDNIKPIESANIELAEILIVNDTVSSNVRL